jgi:hypothetical protein
MIFCYSFILKQMSVTKILNIVITGAESTRERIGTLPIYEDILNAVRILKEVGYEPKVSIIGTNLIYACRMASDMLGPDTVKTYVHDANIVKSYNEQKEDETYVRVYPDHISNVDNLHEYKPLTEQNRIVLKSQPIINLSEYIVHENFRHSLNPTVYLMYGDNALTPYEILSFHDDFEMRNRFTIFSPHGRNVNISDIADDFAIMNGRDEAIDSPVYKHLPRLAMYNVFMGQAVEDDIEDSDFMETFKVILDLCKCIIFFIKAGVNKDKFQIIEKGMDAPGWMLNPETLCIKGCLKTYGLRPEVSDSSPLNEITNSSGYRKQLLELMSKVVASFAVNNGIIDVEKAKELGGWESPRTYGQIHITCQTKILTH